MRWATPLLVAVVVAGCSAPARSGSGALRPGQQTKGNVLLVTIDTLRQDRVGAYGNPGGLTPTLDRLAATGIRYTQARAHAPMTLPSHTSILTGLTPRRSGVRNNTTFRLDERIPTLATFLKRAGYRTGAFIGAFVLDARFGLARDFDVYDDRLPHAEGPSFHFAERRAADVVKAAGDWILDSARPERAPWFAWIHLFDPHAPYDAPAEFRAGRSPYDAEVAYTDAMVGTLLDRLRGAHQLDRTLVVMTADHGESLGEHGETTHGLFAYDATIAVPLIVSGSTTTPGVIDAPVAHVDLVPTILDLVGLEVPSDLDGLSLARSRPADRAIYFEALDAYLTRGWAPLQGIVQNGFKYIDLPEAELYNLAADRGELHNMIGRGTSSTPGAPAPRSRADEMRSTLLKLEAGPVARGSAAPTDAETTARLRSLGYVGGATVTHGAPAPQSVQDDPKRLVALNERFNSAVTMFDGGRQREALSELTAILGERRDFLAARTSAAVALIADRRAGDAVQLLKAAPAQQQQAPDLLAKLGAAMREAGDLRGAAAVLEQARAVAPDSFANNVDAQQNLAIVYAGLRRTEAARALFQDLVARNPAAATAWYNLGLFELQNGRPDAAAPALRRAVEREPAYGDAWNALGAALAGRDTAGAIDAWLHAERLLPRDYDLLFNVGMLLADSGDPGRAIPFLRRFVAEAPRERYARDIARVQQRLSQLK